MRSAVPTVEQRLARVEYDLADLRSKVLGGGDVAWERSVVGRLYDVRQTLLAADNLSRAVREVRRERAQKWSRGEKLALFAFAALTALSPYALLLAHLLR